MQVRVEADHVPELPPEALVGGDLELACAIHLEAVGTRCGHGLVAGARRGGQAWSGTGTAGALASGLGPALHDHGGHVRLAPRPPK